MSWRHFTAAEVTCNCGCGGMPKSEAVDRLDELREMLDRPIHVTSGFRCPDHNERVGGADKSAHMAGIAFDVTTDDGLGFIKLIATARGLGFNGIGVYDHWVHIDLRKTFAFWKG